MSKNVGTGFELRLDRALHRKITLDLIDNSKKVTNLRVKAILDCFGVEAYKEKRCISIPETGEEINFWYIEGVLNVEDLLSIFALDIVVKIYDSGI